MVTLYRRGKVFWLESNFSGVRERRSLRTRDARIAEILRRQVETGLLTGKPFLSAEPFVPVPIKRTRVSSDVNPSHRSPEIEKRRLRKYGLTPERFYALLEKQNFACPICTHPLGDDVYIDHDHGTKDVRGLLHGICNVALGAMETKGPTWTDSALRYLGWRI